MRKVKLKQGSFDWHKFRQGGIGSSYAGAIMGVSPFMSRLELWETLTGRRDAQPPTYIMRRGLAVEKIARRCFEELMGKKFPAEVAIHSEFDHIRASFDGVSEDGEVSEKKSSGIFAHLMAMNSQIQRHTMWQLVHQMAVADRPDIFHVSCYSWKLIPPDFKPPQLKELDEAEEFRPEGFYNWEKVPEHLIWKRDYLDTLQDGESVMSYLGFSKYNIHVTRFSRDKKLEKILFREIEKFWYCVVNDIRPGDLMEEDKPHLRLVGKPVKLSPDSVSFKSEIFKTRKSRKTTTKQAKTIQRSQTLKKGNEAVSTVGKIYTAEEVISILREAKELGVNELKLAGFESSFFPQALAPKLDRTVSNSRSTIPERNHVPENHGPRCQCGAEKPLGRHGYFPLCNDCFDFKKRRHQQSQHHRRNYQY